jgi:hypothetical protein
MIEIDWRSPAAYAHTSKIGAAGFAWEYLRRNDDYRRDYEAAMANGGSPLQPSTFEELWGVTFSQRSRPVR